MKNVVLTRNQSELLEIDVVAIDDWEGFDVLLEYIQNSFDAVITDQADGPESRFCQFLVKGASIMLTNNPYGNTIRASTLRDNPIINTIYEDLNQRLSSVR